MNLQLSEGAKILNFARIQEFHFADNDDGGVGSDSDIRSIQDAWSGSNEEEEPMK